MSKNIFNHKCEMSSLSINVPIRKCLIASLNQNINKSIVVIGLNPSKANAVESDNTVTRLEKYFLKNGYGEMILYNLFQNYSTDPIGICEQTATNFLDTDIQKQLSKADKIVLAYGTDIKYEKYVKKCLNAIEIYKDKLYCFCKDNKECVKSRHPSRMSPNWVLRKCNYEEAISLFNKEVGINYENR